MLDNGKRLAIAAKNADEIKQQVKDADEIKQQVKDGMPDSERTVCNHEHIKEHVDGKYTIHECQHCFAIALFVDGKAVELVYEQSDSEPRPMDWYTTYGSHDPGVRQQAIEAWNRRVNDEQ